MTKLVPHYPSPELRHNEINGIKITASTPVNEYCVFGATVWPLSSPGSKKAIVYGECRVQINWEPYSRRLNSGLVHALKIFAYIYIAHPYLLSKRKAPDAETVVSRIRTLVTALEKFSEEREISSFGEISLKVVLAYLNFAKNLLQIRPAFILLSHINVKVVLGECAFPFVSVDLRKGLKGMSKRPAPIQSNGEVLHMPKAGYQVLPAPLFAFFTRENQRILGAFLCLMGEPVHDNEFDHNSYVVEEARWPQFKSAFSFYLKIRKRTRESNPRHRRALRQKLSKEFFGQFKFTITAFSRLLDDVQMAAISQIMLYTGMRYEEVSLLQRGCIRANPWGNSIHSNEMKRRSKGEEEPEDVSEWFDRWVATDIIVDAVKSLEMLSRIKNSRWLTTSINGNQSDHNEDKRPISNSSLNSRFRRYLKRIDKTGAFSTWRLHCHQFREGLVEQLARMEVRLSYISIQLKHLTYASQAASRGIPAKATRAYGNIPRTLLATLTGADAMVRARMEVNLGLYGEGTRLAGAGATRHRQRTEAFFQGKALFGQARVIYLQNLSRKPLPVFVSGVGVCTLNLAAPEAPREAPPCLGDLHCNPRDCSNSVVPETHRPAVEKRLERARERATDPNRAHAKHFYSEQVSIYESMLKQLNGEEI
ncbi:tyrosine-type recombinase/integrase [Burkholderia pseudomallei]|uniref:tyrosine-type recombinase/integrase n=1 Tax=Burkholderia pseudomallei TaxID=28450 RepID=UPI001AD6F06B|nr:tyrosine-type recombinase/integrase [Burkholderia pseudomallei]MBO7749314.1 site-specific integrase [Burkholderia pseudomallei]